MRSVDERRDAAEPERDARGRILSAAVELFGRLGYPGAGVRTIAERAEVSPGLVLHHFGSKDGLRKACDEYVLAQLFAEGRDLERASDLSRALGERLRDIGQHRPLIDYLARMLAEDAPTSGRLFDAIVEQTERLVVDGVASGSYHAPSDLHAFAVMTTAHGLAPVLLQRQIARALGADLFDRGVLDRVTMATLELYSHGLYKDDRMLDALRSAAAVPASDSE